MVYFLTTLQEMQTSHVNTLHLGFLTFSKAGSSRKVVSVFSSADAILMAETLQNHTTLPSVQAQALLPNVCH